MKKLFSLLCVSAMLLTSLTGCVGTNGTDGAQTNSDTSESATRTVSTVMGDIQVPSNPQRIVANWYVGDVIALGLNLVGYSAWEQETMPFYEELTASTKLENWSPEDVMKLEPDLIVTYQEEDFEKFGKIAPVLVIPETPITSLERTMILGEATGRAQEAEAAVKNFETKLAAAKEELQNNAFQGKTFSILEDWGPSGDWSGVAYETGSRGGTLVYEYLELKKPEKLEKLVAESGKGRGTLSYEVAHEYFGDYILWFQQEGKDSEYAKTEIWKSIPAVTEGRLAAIPGKYQGLFYYSDVASLTAQLDYIIDTLNKLAE
ncbi:ABC transporter substrate-binding protein [Clostridium minihomine]|uniref:ABC transporter substrate-binding protein n=1 Tax=Clostridium minihomine TaxID=2045012 RepID=UPI001FB4AE90|nr:ABC transporter substrate-binding protein [Clostridium minihomine]